MVLWFKRIYSLLSLASLKNRPLKNKEIIDIELNLTHTRKHARTHSSCFSITWNQSFSTADVDGLQLDLYITDTGRSLLFCKLPHIFSTASELIKRLVNITCSF